MEGLERVAAPGEDERAVGDGGPAPREDLEIAAGGQRGEAVGRGHQTVAEDRVRAEQARVVQQLDRRLAVAAEHLVELDEVLADVGRDADAQLVGGLAGGAEQLGAAGVDLERVEHPADAAVVGAVVRADEGLRPLEAPHPGLLVPLVAELPPGPSR